MSYSTKLVGLIAAIAVCNRLCPDSVMKRPSRLLWRVVFGCAFLYFVVLLWMATLHVNDARQFIARFDPRLGVNLPERSYAHDCRIFTPENTNSSFANIKDCITDEFVLAHVVGHWGKAVQIRDWRICFALSVSFELIEITFQHWLPNYLECWWDHLIVDILLCNALGMYLGLKTCQYFQAKELNWVGDKQRKGEGKGVVRLLKQFTPEHWLTYKWEIYSSWKRFLYLLILLTIFNLIENNAFFLKYILWIPADHDFNKYRLTLWWLLGIPGLQEYYNYVSSPKVKKFGPYSTLAVAIFLVEQVACIKWAAEGNIFPQPTPNYITLPTILAAALVALWMILYFTTRKSQARNHHVAHAIDALHFISFLPFVYVFLAGSPDIAWKRDWAERARALLNW